MIRSLRRKFVAVTMAIVTALLCVIFGLVIHFTAANLEGESIRFLRQAAEEPLQPGFRQRACLVVRVTPLGRSVQSAGGFSLQDEQMLADMVAQAASGPDQVQVLEEYGLRCLRQEWAGGITLAFMDITPELDAVRNLKWVCLVIGLAAVAVFWGVSILLARWMVGPVERAWKEQRQFVADASHELKTPLTVILTNAELLQTDPDPRYARNILTMSGRMRELVEGLLELARADNGTVRGSFGEVDLSELTEEALLPFEPLYFEQGLMLEGCIEPGLRISGSNGHLRQVLGILLDNAMKYSRPGGTVRVALSCQGNTAQLTVENPAEKLSREDCRNIFRRFYRIDRARTGGGYGLGLAIAQGIVSVHRGKIWAESGEDTVKLTVQLPLGI